jgi:hypothetical protein
MALKTDISVNVSALLTGAIDIAELTAPHNAGYGRTLLSGTAANQADLVFGDTRTLAASATEDLDLAGVLSAPFGGTVTFARVKMILVTADPGNTNNVIVGGASATQFIGPLGAATHTIAVQPGGMYMAVAPGTTAWPVTAATADLLKVANSSSGTPVSYTIVIVGASA